MPKKNEITIAGKSFEELKQVNDHSAEYWSARALQPMLGYSQWRRFEQAMERAIISCGESGKPSENHFADAGKMVELGSGSVREVEDYQLSRFACYFIAQNGDPRKPEIARAQQYFAIQTRRQELSDQLAADVERLGLRKQTSEEFKALSGAAQDAGAGGQSGGAILWEFKRTKNWNDAWLTKLRDDQRTAKAEIAVIVSQSLPKGVETFEVLEGAWVTHPRAALPAAMILRQSLLELALARQATEGQQTKTEMIYQS